MSLTVIVPTLDEALHVEASVRSALPVADRVFVVDSGSTDGTQDIVLRLAAEDDRVVLVHHPYEGPAAQKNWALDHLAIDTRWVLFLDADERLSPECVRSMAQVTRGRPPVPTEGEGRPAVDRDAHRDGRRDERDDEPVGYFVNRRILFFGRFIRRGGWYPNWNLRLIRRGRGRYEQRRVHEHMVVDGETAFLHGDLLHEDHRDLTFSIAKHNRYSSDEAWEYERAAGDGYARLFTRDPLARRRWLKTRVWARLPFKGPLYFVWAYVIRLGFLDGAEGLRFHMMHAMYKQFDELKQWERRRMGRAGEKVGAPATGPTPPARVDRDLATATSSRAPLPAPGAFLRAVGSHPATAHAEASDRVLATGDGSRRSRAERST